MSSLAIGLLAIAGLFGLLLAAKQIAKNLKYCAICLAVSLTWLSLLVLFWSDVFDDQVLVAVLMGQSSLGLYYLFEKHVPKELLVFRLPLLITLALVAYSLLTLSLALDAVIIAVGLWLVIGVLYGMRANPEIKNKVKALIECCSGW